MKKSIPISVIILLSSVYCFSQDIIQKTDGTKIQSKVLEIEDKVIKYKNFEQLDGPVRTIEKKDISLIQYQDGTVEKFSENINPNNSTQNIDQKIYGDLAIGMDKDVVKSMLKGNSKNYDFYVGSLVFKKISGNFSTDNKLKAIVLQSDLQMAMGKKMWLELNESFVPKIKQNFQESGFKLIAEINENLKEPLYNFDIVEGNCSIFIKDNVVYGINYRGENRNHTYFYTFYLIVTSQTFKDFYFNFK